jgi:aspartyl-tRNA(Asn)/glutamyl-tRNA(Gln) amidotransferase subunit C
VYFTTWYALLSCIAPFQSLFQGAMPDLPDRPDLNLKVRNNMIDRKQVEYIAGLARLAMSEDEAEAFTRQLSAIIGYVEQLEKVDTSGVEPTCFLVPEHDPLRDDIRKDSLPLKSALMNAPETQKDFFAIPKVIS